MSKFKITKNISSTQVNGYIMCSPHYCGCRKIIFGKYLFSGPEGFDQSRKQDKAESWGERGRTEFEKMDGNQHSGHLYEKWVIRIFM